MPEMSAKDFGILVHGHSPKPMLRLDDTPFVELLKRVSYSHTILIVSVINNFVLCIINFMYY